MKDKKGFQALIQRQRERCDYPTEPPRSALSLLKVLADIETNKDGNTEAPPQDRK